jgi:hypothetical protein
MSPERLAETKSLPQMALYLSRYGLLLEQMSAAGKPPSSLHGRIHGIFRKK